MNSLATLMSAWKTQNLRLLPPEPQERVIATFARFGVHPGDQVMKMYSMVGGFEVPDENDWRLWSLREIEAELPDARAEHGILFSDYLIGCWCFRLRPTVHGEMEVVLDECSGNVPQVVARDLASFFDAYVLNPDGVLVPNGRAA
jgi:hypothetical protein